MTERICPLCFKTTTLHNFSILEDDLRANLDISLLKLISDGSRQQIMVCNECRGNLQAFSNFNRACVRIKDETLPIAFVDCKSDVSLDIAETERDVKSVITDPMTCCFCTKIVATPCFISLNNLKKNMLLINLLQKFTSELNLNNTEQIISCESCHNAFRGLPSFVMERFDVEEEIQKYTDVEGADVDDKIDLKKVQEFTFNTTLQQESECCGTFKVEAIDGGKTLSVIKSEPELKCENDEDLQSIIKHEEVDFKSEENESNLNTEQHISTYRDPSQRKVFKCENCTFETTYKSNIKRHRRIHRHRSEIEMHKCELCSFETLYRGNLKNHIMTHKDPSERETFKCKYCEYETKTKSCLWRHLFTHKDPSEITMHKCDECDYETKFRRYFKNHILIHESGPERKEYRCNHCSYDTVSRTSFMRHFKTHMKHVAKPMRKCELCRYKTRKLKALQQHMMTHKDCSETQKYKCNDCAYDTIKKSSLLRHMLRHRDSSEINVLKCEVCTYETKFKQCFAMHMLNHVSKVQMSI